MGEKPALWKEKEIVGEMVKWVKNQHCEKNKKCDLIWENVH